MDVSCGGLVRSLPERPCDDVSGLDAALGEPDGDAPDFLDRPADQLRRGFVRIFLGGVAWFSWWRIAAIMQKASMTSDT